MSSTRVVIPVDEQRVREIVAEMLAVAITPRDYSAHIQHAEQSLAEDLSRTSQPRGGPHA